LISLWVNTSTHEFAYFAVKMNSLPVASPPSIPLDDFAICNSRGRRVSLLNDDEFIPGSRCDPSYSPQPCPSPTRSSHSHSSGEGQHSDFSPQLTSSSMYALSSPRLPPVSDLISFTIPQYEFEPGRSRNSSISSFSNYSRRGSTTSSTSRGSIGAGQTLQPKISKRRYECATCGKIFTTSGHVARHNRIHTGEKNFQCPEPGCSQRFSRQDNCMYFDLSILFLTIGNTIVLIKRMRMWRSFGPRVGGCLPELLLETSANVQKTNL
jgi:uncharacterized Zn-finger protein